MRDDLWSKREQVWNQVERTLQIGTWTWDVATKEVDWSPNLFRVLGFDPETTPVSEAARVFDERIHPDDLGAYLEGQERSLAGDTSRPTRFRFIRPDGTTIHALLLYTKVEDSAGKVVSFAGSILDVTERVQLENELLRAGRLEAIGRLAGSVAHDFNNLLMVVSGNSDLLLLKDPDNEEAKQIRAAVDAGASLTRQLMSFSNQGTDARVTFCLDAVIQDTMPLIQRLLREDIRVRVELECPGVLVNLDPGQLQTALLNLSTNARDAMPMGGDLVLRTRAGHLPSDTSDGPPREAVVLTVEDTGVGMDEETQARLFEPFFTTKDGTQGVTGTGLGLPSVAKFVQRAGGDVGVHSDLGSGTRFELRFPCTHEAESVPTPATSAIVPQGEEILVVEDAPGIRRVLTVCLERMGLVPHVFSSAGDALAEWPSLKDRVRTLVTDVVMPGQSGYELATRLRQDRPELGVVFVTGFDPEGTQLERSVVLAKPFTLAQLLNSLEQVSPLPTSTDDAASD